MRGISELFSRIYPLAPKSFDFKKLSNREISLLLLDFDRREKLDVFARDQYKFSQNSRYSKDVSVEELDRLQKLKPELQHFIQLFFGLDRDEYTEAEVAELGDRLDSLPEQRSTRVSKKSRSRQLLPSLGKSRSRKTLNCSLGKVSVSRDLKICSLEKSRSRRNRKFESRKSLGLDNFH